MSANYGNKILGENTRFDGKPFIYIKLNGHTTKIPVNYILSLDTTKQNDPLLTMIAAWPSFKPYDPDTSVEYDSKRKVTLEDSLWIATWGPKNNLEYTNQSLLNSAIQDGQPANNAGLIHLKSSILSSDSDVYVNYQKSAANATVIACEKIQSAISNPRCDIRFMTNQGEKVQVEFHRSQLMNWREIKSGTLALFNSFDLGNSK